MTSVWLRLGRVSNLPTVWTNALAGAMLAGGAIDPGAALILLIALSLFYVGGMYLNDAFDAKIDARERAERPIPMGEVSRETVFTLGLAMLGAGAVLGFTLGAGAGLAGLALAGCVILYDWLHKRTALSPVIMGGCRFFTYLMAGMAAGGVSDALVWGAIGLFCHVIGLTYAAKQEAYDRIGAAWPLVVLALPVLAGFIVGGVFALVLLLPYMVWSALAVRLLFRRAPGDVPRAVVGLIAGICLYDGALIWAAGGLLPAMLAVAGFAATLGMQKLVSGT